MQLPLRYLLPLLSGLLFLLPQITFSQSAPPQTDGLKTAIRASAASSYATFTEGAGNLEPLIFEAQLAHTFFMFARKKNWTLRFSPHILVRMQDKKSYPIDNPSFKFPLFFHHKLGDASEGFLGQPFLSAGLTHHSNGQAGKFVNPDGSLNLENGSFATNYVTLGLGSYRHSNTEQASLRVYKLYLERHLTWLRTETEAPEELKNRYGLTRLMGQFVAKNFAGSTASRFLQQSGIRLKAGWIFGTLERRPVDDPAKRLLFSLRYLYSTAWMKSIAVFADFYYGQDYYNMRFQRNLEVFRIGISSDLL